MPVSRQRRKKPPRPKSVQQGTKLRQRREEQEAAQRNRAELARAFANLGDERRRLDAQREVIAAREAESLLPELTALGDGRDAAQFEDELCTRLGEEMYRLADAPEIEEYVNQGQFFDAVINAAADAVGRAVGRRDEQPEGWRAPWLLLETVARIAPAPYDTEARSRVDRLRRREGGHLLPALVGSAPIADPQWTRDAYGSRFGVTAPFVSSDGTERWYLWDIDACGYSHFTVSGGYFPDTRQALAAWQATVGPVASAESVFTPVDDPEFLAELLPKDEGFLEPGGETARQFAEYHRSRRLADELRDALDAAPRSTADRDAQPDPPEPADYARRFASWRAEHRPDAPPLPDHDDAIAQLAEDWFEGGLPQLRATCSPHRVAAFAAHVRDYYQEDFASQLSALLPDWVTWFADRLGLSPDLAERCLPYANGEPHPAQRLDGQGLEMLACVEE
jgi:hypothetical protein